MADETRGLPLARELLARVDGSDPDPIRMSGRIAHAQAIATVELAAATQLQALILFTGSPTWGSLMDDEQADVRSKILAMLGIQ